MTLFRSGAVTVLENMERLGVSQVNTVVTLHGTRTGSLDELLADAGRTQPKTTNTKAE